MGRALVRRARDTRATAASAGLVLACSLRRAMFANAREHVSLRRLQDSVYVGDENGLEPEPEPETEPEPEAEPEGSCTEENFCIYVLWIFGVLFALCGGFGALGYWMYKRQQDSERIARRQAARSKALTEDPMVRVRAGGLQPHTTTSIFGPSCPSPSFRPRLIPIVA